MGADFEVSLSSYNKTVMEVEEEVVDLSSEEDEEVEDSIINHKYQKEWH